MKLVWSRLNFASRCFWSSAWISPRVCSMIAGLTPAEALADALADASGAGVVGVHAAMTAHAARTTTSRFMSEQHMGARVRRV